jgi:NAD(P)-dependent dehydrogenase (short-subunit alcohol dehydrogenase family)
MYDLTGRTVLVTGASKGIGQATVVALGAAGANVIAHYGSDEAGAREAVSEIPPDRRLVLQADLAAPGETRRLWNEALAWKGDVDVLVNNAAVLIETPLDDSDEAWADKWARTWDVNVRAAADLVRDAVRHFQGRGGGVLVGLSSWVAQRGSGNPDLLAYSASKGAIKGLVHTIARNHAKEGVLAYLIAPGVVRTQMSVDAAARQGGEAKLTASLAMGDWVPPAEIAELIVFLATGRQRHLTGATFDVNGASYIR